jgi:Zn-dependent M28 family amino/carboxypeptidase
MKESKLILFLVAAGALCGGCAAPKTASPDRVGFPAIDSGVVLRHIQVLASDEYEGRAPGTKGEAMTTAYIVDQFKSIGLKPGNIDGSYIQKVPLIGITADPNVTMTFKKGSREQKLRFKDEFVAWTKRATPTEQLDNSEMVFVGYGVQAPEFNWDDYKGVDLKGKTMVVLVGDPPVADPADPSRFDPTVFGGKAMTYYGRWTYKYEMGAKMGAAGVLIVHETEPAGYPFSVVQSKVTEQFDLVAPDKNMSRSAVEGWITLERARNLFTLSGQNFGNLKKAAVSREFKPVPLGVSASIVLHNTLRTIDSGNVVGKLEGSDPKLKNEYVIFTSHWDHFGIGPEVNGSKIYHGAVDNASGVGGLIEIARAFAALAQPPKRSLLFLSVTAEEQGLLGSEYYAQNPIYPLAKTLALVNMDALNVYGKTRDITITGLGNSDLDEYARQIAAEQGRVVKPDPMPEKGSYYRSDHFPFARHGVPALASGSGIDYIGKPTEYGRQVRNNYTTNDYHKPSDVVKPDWDLSGAVQDLQYYWMVGYRIAQAEKYPEWSPGSEFKTKRDEQLKALAR